MLWFSILYVKVAITNVMLWFSILYVKVAITNVMLWFIIWTPYAVITSIACFGNPMLVSPLVSQLPAFLG